MRREAALQWADKITKKSGDISVFSLTKDGKLKSGALERKIAAAIKAATKIDYSTAPKKRTK